MVRLVDDLLDISRITRNKMEMRKARIELWAVVQSAVETARPQIEANGHKLTVTLPPHPVYLDGDLTRLPVSLGAVAGEHTQAHGVVPPGPRRRILVVDDNRDGAASLAMLLTVMGNDTRTAHDGMEGVEQAEAFRPDLIVLDIGLPKLNGYDACRRMRQMPWAKDTLIVAATGWGQDEDRRRSKDAGFDHHLVKPVDAAELNRLLAERKP
jgi:CheY-like chemotaxis protein